MCGIEKSEVKPFEAFGEFFPSARIQSISFLKIFIHLFSCIQSFLLPWLLQWL